jgi:hypothetical protein
MWTRAEVLARLNLIQDGLDLILGGLIQAYNTSLTSVASQGNYSIPATIRDLISATYDGDNIEVTTEDKLDSDSKKGIIATGWRSETGVPTAIFPRGSEYILYPIPTITGKTIGLYHKVLLTALTDSTSSYPLNTVERLRIAQMLLVLYTVIDLAAEEGDTTQMTTVKAEIDFYQGPIKRETQLGRKAGAPSYPGKESEEDDR